MKLHKDWIVDLYYKEMVIGSNKEKNHEKYKRPKQQTEKDSKRYKGISKSLQSQKSSYENE